MIILVGDSASGKSTIERNLVEKHGFAHTISYTTRPPRNGEQDGINYHFVSEQTFLSLKQDGFFVETTHYNGNYYGTAKQDCTDDKIAVVNPQGLRAFRNCKGISVTSFYIRVPRRDRLIKALVRGDDIDLSYQRNLSDLGEFTGVADEVDFVIDNENYKYSVDEMTDIVLSKLNNQPSKTNQSNNHETNEFKTSLVRFKDTLEENATDHFGVLMTDGTILCLCCGGIVEPEDYKIIENYDSFAYLDDTLKQYF